MQLNTSTFVALVLVCVTLVFAAEAQAQLESHLIGYWQFDGSFEDSSPSSLDLTPFGGVGFTPGRFGNDQSLSLPSNPGQFARRGVDDQILDFGNSEFTIQVWVYYNDESGEQVMVEKWDGSGWTLTKLGNNLFRFDAGSVGVTSCDNTCSPCPDCLQPLFVGSWTQVVVRRRSCGANMHQVELFYNRALEGVRACFPVDGSSSIPDTAQPLLIGQRTGGGSPMNGRLDEIAIWNRALSDAELDLLWNAGAGRPIIDCNNNGIPDGIEADTDGDGVIDACDDDDDNDGVPDGSDSSPFNPDICEDTDTDGCDDCAVGTDDFGPLPDNDPSNDGTDMDGDGMCDAGDVCPLDNPDDPDADGVCTSDDNCELFNPDQADCQPNGVGDVCDVADATSADCNANGIPDECEIADASSEDCNTNETPDECDIGRGVSEDCDVNGVPDECESPDCPASLERISVNGGGTLSTVGPYALIASTGQPGGVGVIFSESYELADGFWHAAGAGCGPCPTDVDGNGETEAFDLANLLGKWGPVTPSGVCLDANGNGFIEAFDLAVLLGKWGPCP